MPAPAPDPPSDDPRSRDEGSVHTRVFRARMASLDEVTAFIEHVAGLAGLTGPVGLRLALLVEELFTNTVVHGHRGDCEAPVRLSFRVEPGRIALAYEDTAPPHNPFQGLAPPDDSTTVEDRPVGGLGVLLVAAMATDVAYSRVEDQNRIFLVVSAPK